MVNTIQKYSGYDSEKWDNEKDYVNWQIQLLMSCLSVVNGNANAAFTIIQLTNDEETEHYGYGAFWVGGTTTVSIEVEETCVVLDCRAHRTTDSALSTLCVVFGEDENSTSWDDLYDKLLKMRDWFHYAYSQLNQENTTSSLKNAINQLTTKVK